MKSLIKNKIEKMALVAMVLFSLSSCNKEEPTIKSDVPTSTQFNAMREGHVTLLKKNAQFRAETGTVYTSDKGVKLTIPANALTLDGNLVTGNVDIEYIEILDKGHMLTTLQTTMGVLPSGNKSMLLSGGEVMVNITKDGRTVTPILPMPIEIPTALTGDARGDMDLFDGVDSTGKLNWIKNPNADVTVKDVQIPGGGSQSVYSTVISKFGWTNVDRFYSDPRPKTQILVSVPEGYNDGNSAVCLSYDGEVNSALARLDRYDGIAKLFSEHYGQIPVGLACHIIYMTATTDGKVRYAIKPVTITAGATYNFTLAETSVTTESALVTTINALP